EPVYQGAASAVTSSTIDRLMPRGALGATDLEGALRSVSPLLHSRSFRRVVLISDGLTSLGRVESQQLQEIVGAWSRLGVRRLDAVVLRPEYHDSLLRELTTTSLPERGVVVTVTDSFNSLIRLETKTTADLSVTVDGAIAQSPRTLRGVEPGDLVWIHARVPAARPLSVRLAGVPLSISASREAYYPLLERVFPHRGIGVQPKPPRGAYAEQLEIRDGHLEAIEVRTRPPTCRCDRMHVSGRLPPETIQRIVRLNHGRFRGCYHQALLSKPTLAGRVAVRFVIGPVGQVTSVRDEGSTLESPATTRCILEAFSRLEFPMPEGGDVTVVYPLRLTPDGSVEDSDTKQAAASPSPSSPPLERVELLDPQYPLRPRDVGEEAYLGGFAVVMKALRERRWRDAASALQPFERQSAQDLISMLARAQYAEQRGEPSVARRAYGSLLDLYPRDASIRRLVAAHWARLGDAAAIALVRTSLEGTEPLDAECDMTQRQLAWAWVKDGNYRRALELLVRTLLRCLKTPQDGSSEVLRLPELLQQDVSRVARAAIAATPARQSEIFDLLRTVGVQPATGTSLRFLLSAEHGTGLSLGLYPEPSHGRVRGVDQWFGPHQAFTIADQDRLDPYTVHVRNLSDLYARHATSFGYVEIVEQDVRGALRVEHRPFVFQTSRSEIDLGKYGGH
ncbi:MAG TPA: AgmX/PglI C-terminal domain-containing protein, partial [Polyangiaceae bacterium]|nr:AgmX/PglI C-terminal domain-containing protein [Polyangiaceae bacterium]